MRGNRIFVVLAAAVVLGLAASFMVWRYMHTPVELHASPESPRMVRVVTAAVDLPVGTLIREEQLKALPMDGSHLPAGYFVDRRQLAGRGVLVPIAANEMLLEAKLVPEGAGAGLSAVIPQGMRAVSVKVDEVIGVAGFVLPGTRVDVLVTVDPTEEAATSLTKLVLQNIHVLAAGESIQKDAEGKPMKVTVITLLVTPDDSERLTLAATEGHIQLALRNVLDQAPVATRGSDIVGLVRNEALAPEPAPGPPARKPASRQRISVELYRGVEKEVQQF